jgi:hypothetical protein
MVRWRCDLDLGWVPYSWDGGLAVQVFGQERLTQRKV